MYIPGGQPYSSERSFSDHKQATSAWARVLHDVALAQAIVDRILLHSAALWRPPDDVIGRAPSQLRGVERPQSGTNVYSIVRSWGTIVGTRPCQHATTRTGMRGSFVP
jgi:hypothetical protein